MYFLLYILEFSSLDAYDLMFIFIIQKRVLKEKHIV